MKQFSKFFLALAATTMLFSCSSDEPNPAPTPDADGNGFYASVKFTMPKSRAGSSQGIEVGQDYENKVSSLLIVLAKKEGDDYQFLSQAYEGNPKASGANYTICFQNKDALFNYANPSGAEKDVYVFAYCNPTDDLKDAAKALETATDKSLTTFFNKTFKGTEEELATTWKNEGFLMTNHGFYTAKLPNQETLKACSTPETAYNLTNGNAIEVMRTAVRFDFRDASNYKDKDDKSVALTYAIKDVDDATKTQGTVTLTRAALFNMRDEFYYLPRTKGADGETLLPGATATDHDFTNWMVTPSNRNYLKQLPATSAATGFDPTTVLTESEWSVLSEVIAGTEDKDDGWGTSVTPPADKMGYRIWRYCTENAFAYSATAITADLDQATGIVFEAEINLTPAEGVTAPNGTDPIYQYNGTLYPNAITLCQVAEENKASQIYTDVFATFDYTVTDGKVTTATLKETFKDALYANSISIYRPKNNKYYCYYYYFNRHNDNNDAAVTLCDEFATIRNNVYKLAVTNIKQVATTKEPEKVEDWDVFFIVEVMVFPWTVRINNIEF